jgi:hypothetical protein
MGSELTQSYIGEALNIRKRIEQPLETNVPLMKAIESRSAGQRILMTGVLAGSPGLQKKKTVVRVQNALIKWALAQGAELTNVHGARTKYDAIRFDGHLKSRTYFGREMNIEK